MSTSVMGGWVHLYNTTYMYARGLAMLCYVCSDIVFDLHKYRWLPGICRNTAAYVYVYQPPALPLELELSFSSAPVFGSVSCTTATY